MKIKAYDWRNTILEVALGVAPMAILLWLSNGPSDFSEKVKSYIPSHEIQLLFACYLGFGVAFSTLSLRFNFSKTLLLPSLEFISAFISIGQAFAGFLLFALGLSCFSKGYGQGILLILWYYGFHVATINLASYLAVLKHRYRHVLADD